MSSLLPPSATPLELALAESTARIAEVPIVVREMWNPDTCPSNMLGWLAWAFSVDEWDASWSESQKRATINRSVTVHRYKGTIGAVQEALAGLFINCRVQEWFNQIPPAPPFTFRILLEAEQVGLGQASMASLLSVVERTKNLRSHMNDIELSIKTQASRNTAIVTCLGSEITVMAERQKVIINENALVG